MFHLCFGTLRDAKCLIHRHEECNCTDKSILAAGGSSWSLLGFLLKNKNNPSTEDGKKFVQRETIFRTRTLRSENPHKQALGRIHYLFFTVENVEKKLCFHHSALHLFTNGNAVTHSQLLTVSWLLSIWCSGWRWESLPHLQFGSHPWVIMLREQQKLGPILRPIP